MHVHAGNIHDTKGGVYTFEKALYRYPTLIGVRADQGYRGTFKNRTCLHKLKSTQQGLQIGNNTNIFLVKSPNFIVL